MIQTPMKMLALFANRFYCIFTQFVNCSLDLLDNPTHCDIKMRDFLSQMKLIKTWSSIQRERSNSSAIMSIEAEIIRSLILDKIL